MGVKNILITDREDISKALEASFLGRGGFHILKAQTADEAFQFMEEFDLFLSVLSLDMPGLEDGDLLHRIKSDPLLSTTPLIAISSKQGDPSLHQAAYDLCDATIERPLETVELQSILCRLLGVYEREFKRYDVRGRLFLETESGKRHPAKMVNISEGGAFVKTAILFPVGTELTLRGDIGKSLSDISISTRVVWVNHPEWLKTNRMPEGMGLKFLVCPDDVKKLLDELNRAKGQKS